MTNPLLPRGVYRAPLLGRHGEIVLFAVDSAHRQIEGGRLWLQAESDVEPAMGRLWCLLDALDPPHDIIPIHRAS